MAFGYIGKILHVDLTKGSFEIETPDEAKLFVGLKPEDRMVLFVGRIERLKGVRNNFV